MKRVLIYDCGYMKKTLVALLLAVIFVSCEGPMGPQGPAGYDGADGGDWGEYSYFTVKANQWQSDGIAGTNSFYYYYNQKWDELDEMAVERGIVIGYVVDHTGGYTTMPYVYHDKDNEQGFEWTKTTSFSYDIGVFEIQVTNSDFYDDPPGDMSFRIIVFR